jgi:hypothetical protein
MLSKLEKTSANTSAFPAVKKREQYCIPSLPSGTDKRVAAFHACCLTGIPEANMRKLNIRDCLFRLSGTEKG